MVVLASIDVSQSSTHNRHILPINFKQTLNLLKDEEKGFSHINANGRLSKVQLSASMGMT